VGTHGGKRLGAGKKPKVTKELAAQFFAGVISDDDLKRIIRSHVGCDDPKISFEAAKWLADHKFGKPSQRIEHDGEIEHLLIADL
jgi:hypothetical protein